MKAKGLWLGVAIAVLLGVIGLSIHFSKTTTARNFHSNDRAHENKMKTSFDFMVKTLADSARVTAAGRRDAEKIIEAWMKGRYGEDGSKAMFQWIQENNSSWTLELHNKLMDKVEALRLQWKGAQDARTANMNSQHNWLDSPWNTFWIGGDAEKRIDFQPIVSGATGETFETGVDNTDPLSGLDGD